jgi:GxxExxY protein
MAVEIFESIPPEIERVGRRVIGSGIAVHSFFGPGYKEPIYVEAMCIEMDSRGLQFEREKLITVHYKGREVGRHRLDLLVEGVLILECKVAESLKKLHTRQVTSYLRATKLRLGYVFNFNVDVLTRGGIKRVVL